MYPGPVTGLGGRSRREATNAISRNGLHCPPSLHLALCHVVSSSPFSDPTGEDRSAETNGWQSPGARAWETWGPTPVDEPALTFPVPRAVPLAAVPHVGWHGRGPSGLHSRPTERGVGVSLHLPRWGRQDQLRICGARCKIKIRAACSKTVKNFLMATAAH